MRSWIFWMLLLVLIVPLRGVERKIALEDMRLELNDVATKLQGQQLELELVREEIQAFQKSLDSRKEGPSSCDLEIERQNHEKRIASLEKSNKSLLADLKTLKDHLNATTDALLKYEEKLLSLDNLLSSEVKTLKSSLQSMLSLLQGNNEKTYIVQPGDSLGKIALDHHLSIKSLKELNSLNNDQIFVGQKLLISK